MRRLILAGALALACVAPAEAGPFGIFPRHRTRWANESAVVWQQPAEWSYQASYQAAPCPCDCGQPAAVAPLQQGPVQQGPVNAANPANAVQPMPANPPRLLGTAPGT